MSDERQAFEQLHAIPSGAIWCEKRHIYIHKNYSGMVLHPINQSWEAFCEGALWQASRQGVEGEPVAVVDRVGIMQRLFPYTNLPEGTKLYTHPARDGQDSVAVVNKASTGEYEFYPSSNLVDIPNGMHKLYTHPASADVPEKWRTVMKELADDLESEIEARRSGDLDRRIERDLIVVKEARVLLDEQEQDHE